jgi:hypothetical protein
MAKTKNPHDMTAAEFTRAVNRLWGSVYASRVELGMSLRQVQRFASGERPVPVVVARLLRAYLHHGLPAPD